jgi:hypothetical protein
MNIARAPQLVLELAAERTDTLLRLLRPGQLLRASVIDTPRPGIARLRIGGQQLNARTPLPLQKGETLLLQVARGLPHPLLRLNPKSGTDARLPPTQQLARHALARALPPEVIEQQLARIPAQALPRLPQAERLMLALRPPATSLKALDPDTLQRTIQQSGIFLEALLGRGQTPHPDDRKLQLLRLLQDLQSHPSAAPKTTASSDLPSGAPGRMPVEDPARGLLRLVEGSIAHIQQHQAHALAHADSSGQAAWRLDLPLQVGAHRDHLQLTIEEARGDHSGTDTDPLWKVEIRFDFRELGEVLCRISLVGDAVRCAFWSERATTAGRFEAALPRLRKTLERAGLEVAAVSSLQGQPAQTRPFADDALLDERA